MVNDIQIRLLPTSGRTWASHMLLYFFRFPTVRCPKVTTSTHGKPSDRMRGSETHKAVRTHKHAQPDVTDVARVFPRCFPMVDRVTREHEIQEHEIQESKLATFTSPQARERPCPLPPRVLSPHGTALLCASFASTCTLTRISPSVYPTCEEGDRTFARLGLLGGTPAASACPCSYHHSMHPDPSSLLPPASSLLSSCCASNECRPQPRTLGPGRRSSRRGVNRGSPEGAGGHTKTKTAQCSGMTLSKMHTAASEQAPRLAATCRRARESALTSAPRSKARRPR